MARQTVGHHLTVGELRAMLRDLPDDYLVDTEGCDCIGPSDGIEVDAGSVMLTRNDRLPYPVGRNHRTE